MGSEFEKVMEHYQTQQIFGAQGITVGNPTSMTKVDDKSENVKRFEKLNEECATIYAKKNKDYGDSFKESLDEDGLLVAKIRLGDKYKRFAQLIKNPAEVTDEKMRDTLMDMANYAKMTIMWLDGKEAEEPGYLAGADLDGDKIIPNYVGRQLKRGPIE